MAVTMSLHAHETGCHWNRRNALGRLTSSTSTRSGKSLRARSRGRASTGTGTGTRPSGAQAGQQTSRFTPLSKPLEPLAPGYMSRSHTVLESAHAEWLRTRCLAEEEVA